MENINAEEIYDKSLNFQLRDMAASRDSINTTSNSTSKKRKTTNLVNGDKKKKEDPLQYAKSENFQQISNRNVAYHSFLDGQNNIDSLTENKLHGEVSRIVTFPPNFKSPVTTNLNNNQVLDNSTLGTETACSQREQPITSSVITIELPELPYTPIQLVSQQHINSVTFIINQNDELQLIPITEFFRASRFSLNKVPSYTPVISDYSKYDKFGLPLNRFIPHHDSFTFLLNPNNELHLVSIGDFIITKNPKIIYTLEGPIELRNCNMIVMCKYLFTSLLRFPTQSKYNATQMQKCIQELIDGRISLQAFFNHLREFLNVQALSNIISFLGYCIPDIQHALTEGKMSIAGINPPPRSGIHTTVSVPPGGLPVQENNIITPASDIHQLAIQKVKSLRPHIISNVRLQSPVSNKNKNKEEVAPNISYRDINDVVAMGGVNLAEENQELLNTNCYMGMPERSCEEIYLLNMQYLLKRLLSVLPTQSIKRFHAKVPDVISHALEERLKNWIEDLAILSEERLSNIAQQKMTNEEKFLVEFNIGQDDLQSEEVSISRTSSRLNDNLNFDPSQASYGGESCYSRLDLYLRGHIKTAELEDLVVILKRDKEYCTSRPFIRAMLIKLML